MNYEDPNIKLYELGIFSAEEAQELEYELDIRFEDFSPIDRETWLKQTAYLEYFSHAGTITSSAREAGVTVYTVQRWQREDALGFTRRLEVATLAFNDGQMDKAVLRASEPDAPVTLIIALLRANMPEKFSTAARRRDTSASVDASADEARSLDALAQYSEGAQWEKANGYAALNRIAQGDPDPFRDESPSAPSEVSPSVHHAGEDRQPEASQSTNGASRHAIDRSPTDIADEVTSSSAHSPTHSGREGTSPSAMSRHENPPDSPSVVSPSTADLTRAAKREFLRQHKKQRKRDTFPVTRF